MYKLSLTFPSIEANKSGFGGFSFGAAAQQPKVEPAKEAFGGFNFVKPENKTATPSAFGNSPSIPAISSDQKSGFSSFQPNASENVLKRNRDEIGILYSACVRNRYFVFCNTALIAMISYFNDGMN